MKRIDGFLCIDDCNKELAHEHHKKTNHYWIQIDGTEYYFKPTKNYYNELLAYHTANFLGLDACYCDLAILNGEKGIISKSLRAKDTKLISGQQIIKDYAFSSISNLMWIKKMIKDSGFINYLFDDAYRDKKDISIEYIHNLEIIWHALEAKYKDNQNFNIEKIMHQLVLMYIFTILVYDCDKYSSNWLLEESPTNIKLAPLFDNEDAFNYTNKKTNQNNILKFATNAETSDYNQLSSLKAFLSTSTPEYYDLFVDLFEKLSNNFDKILKNAETQIGTNLPTIKKEKIILGFHINMEQINTILKEFKSNQKQL